MNLKQSFNNMNHNEYVLSKRNELIHVVNLMLNDEINLIEGVRKICHLRVKIDDPENEIFLPFIAIDSETDHYPLGEKMRANCDEEYLKLMDKEIEEYLKEERQNILNTCKDLLKAYNA